MTEFKVRAYGKSELAWLYFPTANSAHTAVNHLMAWVRRNPDLVNGLHKLGYRKSAKFFTPKEIALIIGGKTKCVKMNETLNQWKAL